MAHPQQSAFIGSIRTLLPQYFWDTKVLEVGSLDINGSVREFFFDPVEYVGCDLGPGPGVDLVCRGHELPFDDGTFDVAISCECFEHDVHWRDTFQKMIDLVRSEGLVLFTCATTGRAEHGTSRTNPLDSPFTNDYYATLEEKDFDDFLPAFDDHYFATDSTTHDLYFWGLKR